MKKTRKIGWQKYEDIIESQISSPLIDKIYQSMSRMVHEYQATQEEEDHPLPPEGMEMDQEQPIVLNMDESLAGEIAVASNFDCWVAHTNFNLTENIKNQLDCVDGVEMLKVFSRYRFLIGIGRMFDFTEVRANIESKLETID